jgi:hypothetical protein
MGLSSATSAKARQDPSSDHESEHHTYVSTDKEKDPFRPAQWTLRSDLEATVKGTGTGLEDMFSTSFKLGDDTPTQTPRRVRHREVGGDGREVFERASAQTAAAAAATAKMVGSNLQMFIWPVVLAILAIIVAVARDPSGRQWASERLEEALMSVKPVLGARDIQGFGHAPGTTHEQDIGAF